MRTKRSTLLIAGFLVLAGTQSCVDDDGSMFIIAPDDGSGAECTANDGEENTSEAFGAAQTIQILYSASDLLGLKVGDIIKGLAIRADSTMTAAWPIMANGGFNVFKVKLGKGKSTFTKDSLAANFDETDDPAVEVRSGTHTFAAGAFTFGNNGPNAFGPVIPFNQATFEYKGGPLIVEIRTSAASNGEPIFAADRCGSADGANAKSLFAFSVDGDVGSDDPINVGLVVKLIVL